MLELIHDSEFWVAVAFAIAVGLIWWRGRKAALEVLDLRAAKIRDELDEAQRLREQAEATLADYQRRQREALAEAKEIARRATAEAERMAVQSAADLETMLKRREQLARERIAQAEAAAVAEIRSAAVEIAIAAARDLIRDSLDPARSAELIDEAIRELPQQLH